MADVRVKAVISAEDKASRVIQGVGSKMSSLGKTMTRRVTLPVVAGFGLAIKSAIDFESSFAGVRKTVDATEGEFAELEKRFRGLSKVTPININEINRIAELAGQLGVSGVDNLEKFTKTVADLSVTTNLTSEAAATDLARIANVMQLDVGQSIDRMGSSIVDLGNNFATTESEISNFANRIAGAGRIAGLSAADVFGISAAFSSVGVAAERGGTAVSKSLFSMTRAVESGGDKLQQFADVAGVTAEEFTQAFEKDAAKAFDLFIQGLSKNGIKATGLLEELELSDQRLQQAFISVAGAGGLMSEAIDTSSKAFQANNALTEEANKRYGTTESKVQVAKNNLNDLAITIGTELIPQLIPLVEDISKIIEKFANMDAGTRQNILRLIAFGAAIGPILTVVGTFIGAIKLATKVIGIFKLGLGKVIGKSGATKGALGGLAKFVKSPAFLNPWTAFAAVAVGAFITVQNKARETKRVVDKTNQSVERSGDIIDDSIRQVKAGVASGKISKEEGARIIRSFGTPGNALGGTVTAGSPVTVGEEGPEVFVPNRGGEIVPNHKLGGATLNFNVNIGMFAGTAVERRKLAQTMWNDIERIASKQGLSAKQMLGM